MCVPCILEIINDGEYIFAVILVLIRANAASGLGGVVDEGERETNFVGFYYHLP